MLTYRGVCAQWWAQWKQGRHAIEMNQDKAKRPMRTAQRDGKKTKPEWADGLRQLYDSVLNEPLPDSLADLLSKLDKGDQ